MEEGVEVCVTKFWCPTVIFRHVTMAVSDVHAVFTFLQRESWSSVCWQHNYRSCAVCLSSSGSGVQPDSFLFAVRLRFHVTKGSHQNIKAPTFLQKKKRCLIRRSSDSLSPRSSFPTSRFFNKTFGKRKSMDLSSVISNFLFILFLTRFPGLRGTPWTLKTVSLPHKMRSAPLFAPKPRLANRGERKQPQGWQISSVGHEVQLLQLSWSNKWQIKRLAANTAGGRRSRNTDVSRVWRRQTSESVWSFSPPFGIMRLICQKNIPNKCRNYFI